MKALRWLQPGLGIKRWLILFTVGVALVSLGLAVGLRASVLGHFERVFQEIVYLATGRLLPSRVSGLLVFLAGTALSLLAVHRIARAFLAVFPGELSDALYQRRHLGRGPKIVAIGGGTGLSTVLRGLKQYTSNITAVVTVTDDGGSSGRLRGELGILPPGDLRNCLVALADTEPLMEKLFQYRFAQGKGLAGHNFGNLFIAAMSEITGDFEEALRELSKVLAVRGRVLPSTRVNAVLCAELADGRVVRGESAISAQAERIKRVFLEPGDCSPVPEALAAIAEADAIILGPGSLYTSVLPNLLVRGMAEAIRSSAAVKIYVCNVMTEPGETIGFTASDHLQVLADVLGPGVIQHVLVNVDRIPPEALARYAGEGSTPVAVDRAALWVQGVDVTAEHLVEVTDLVRHHSGRLALVLLRLILRSRPRLEGRRTLAFYMLAERLKGREMRGRSH